MTRGPDHLIQHHSQPSRSRDVLRTVRRGARTVAREAGMVLLPVASAALVMEALFDKQHLPELRDRAIALVDVALPAGIYIKLRLGERSRRRAVQADVAKTTKRVDALTSEVQTVRTHVEELVHQRDAAQELRDHAFEAIRTGDGWAELLVL